MSQAPLSRSVSRDPVFRLLYLNMGLVIVGYALGVLTGMISVGPMRVVKYSFLLISILYLLTVDLVIFRLLKNYLQALTAFSFLFVVFALLSSDPISSIGKVLTYVVPFLYLAFSVGYLLLKYPTLEVNHAFINAINWVYFIPVVSYFLTGGKITDTNIYSIEEQSEDTAFVSNHYGWAGTIFLLTALDLLRNVSLPWWRKGTLAVFGVIAVYLVFISGNRTSWLSLALVTLVFIFRYRKIPLYQKILLSLVPLGIVFHLAQDPDSAINSRLKKTQTQQKKGEPRAQLSRKMVAYFNKNPDLWLTGIGMFNKEKIKSIANWTGYHNSYFEVLFGSGIVVFAVFLYLIVIRPVWYYLRYYSTYYLFFLPLLVIPYFESNLTGGQFLFFPWFTAALFMGYSPYFAKMKIGMNSIQP